MNKLLTTVEYADNYAKSKLDGDLWMLLDEETKIKTLYEAQRTIFSITDIALSFELDTSEDIQIAVCETAINITNIGTISSNPHLTDRAIGIKSLSFGKDSVNYGDNTSGKNFTESIYINDYTAKLLEKYIKRSFPYV